MLNVAEDAEAVFGNIKLDDAAVKESIIAGKVTVANDADIRNMTVAANGSMTVEGTANILGNTAFNVLDEFNAGNMVIGETFAEDEEAVATTVNVSGVHGKVVSENVTVNANAVLNITGTASFTCNGIIDNDGVINVTGAKLSAEEISNIGTAAIVISGNSTVNAVVTGNGSLRLVDGAVLGGVLTAPVLYVEGSASFAENASFTGMINGRTIYVSGDKNVLDIAMDSKATLVVADGTVFTDDNLGDIAIKGEKKDVVLTVADEAFNGNTLENVMLNIVDVEGDRINVSIDLDKVLTIDGYELKNVNGVYYYEGEEGNMFVGRMEENGKYFIQLFDGTKPGASTVEDVKNIKVNDNDDYPELANVNVRMQEGNTTISVTGKKSDIVEFAVGSILKSEKGGSNTVKFGNYTDVSVNGSIESLAKLTIGNNAKVTVGAKDANGDFLPYTGNITGQNKNNAVKIGSDSTVDIAGTIDLMGGKNTMAVGARSTVTVGGSVKGISALTVASGKAAANNITDLDIDGMFVAAAANNKITIGNYARFTLGAVDGVSIENDGVESATGTTISVGKESDMIVDGSANGIAKLTAGKNAIVTFGGNIDGTEKNNAVKIGEAAKFMAADIDLAGGKNSISTGKGSEFSADVVSNVQTITVGTQSTFEAESISGVNKITVSAGKAPKKDAPAIYINVAVDGDVVMTTGKDSFKVGSYSNVAINGTLTFGDGKDTLTLGKDAQLLAGDIEGMEVFNASKGAKLIVLNGQGDDVDLDAVSGSWKNATIIDGEGLLQDVNTGMVYANERDMFEYDLTGSGKIALENFSEGMEIYYAVEDNGVYGEFQLYTEGTELTAGSYRFEVSVAGEYTDKLEKKNYSFTVAELA